MHQKSTRMKLTKKIFTILHRFFDIVIHSLFRVAYFGKKEPLPPLNNLLLLEPASSLSAMIRKKKLKSVDLVALYISRVKEVNPVINAAVNFRFKEALQEAQEADEMVASGDKTEEELEREVPFLGVPLSVKEIIAVQGLPLTAGLVSRRSHRSTSNAETVRLMRGAGAIPFVTTNTSELGMWYESYNRVYGRTANPYDSSRTCGGSSGGEGALLGAAASVMGLGSDIGGSIRIPAFFNGVFGHKPTPEIVSNYGTYPPSGEREFVPYLCLGPMCRYASDLLPMMKVLSGKNAPLLRLNLFPVPMKDLRVFFVEDVGNHLVFTKVESDLIDALHKVVNHFSNAYNLIPQRLQLPSLRHMYVIWSSVISSCKAPRFSDELAERKGTIHFKRELLRWMIGQSPFTFPAIVLGLIEKRVLDHGDRFLNLVQDLRRELLETLKEDGILLFLPHPTVAPHHNEPVFKPFNFAYTAIFNALGFPVTQVPLGLGREGLPLGVQVVAAPFQDRLTLSVALELEKVFGGWRSPSVIQE